MPRWVARPPGPYRSSRTGAPPPYPGPPRYQGGIPRWGFPPVVWVPNGVTPVQPAPQAPGLGAAICFAALTAVAAGVAAAAEIWRYVLLIRGRTEVLPAREVWFVDDLVLAAGLVALLTGVASVLAVVSVLGRLTDFAADRAGVRPPRDDASRLLRLLVPGYNLFGAGQVIAEVDGLLRLDPEDRPARPRPSRWVSAWWIAWVLNGLLVIALIVRTRTPGLQAEADSVLLHAVVDLSAMVVAGLTVAVAVGLRRLTRPSRTPDLRGWIPAIPA